MQSGHGSSDEYEEAPPDAFKPDALVVFTGPEHVREFEHFLAQHPGMVISSASRHATVRWADKSEEGWFYHPGVFDPEWLTEVSRTEFDAAVSRVRASDWEGFPPRRED
ncbi:hypothetical protein GTR02_05255 [Kineococcus sp. R8]|uniref:hypothetical protein n=1 Tax=Kineococcus siccus TaxID=2696567 RepID=UPI0014128211|nr:hypothetical protein [Kineococcus siccus]NAZ81218.1 hypothetical protein [Kineococcus siccus]